MKNILPLFILISLIMSSCSGSTGPNDNNTKDENSGNQTTTGTLKTIVKTTGVTQSATYTLTVNDADSKNSAINDTTYFTDLDEGDSHITLAGYDESCTLDQATKSFSITAEDTTSVNFVVECPDVESLHNKIVYQGQDANYNFTLFSINGDDGSGKAEIKTDVQEGRISISPDGKKIAFADGGLFIENVDGSGLEQLTSDGKILSIDWSPDGARLAFAQDGDIYIINSDGTGKKNLTTTADNYGLTWSPDGQKIAFSSDKGYETSNDPIYSIYVINIDGTNLTQLTDTQESAKLPDWSPNGDKIVYSSSKVQQYGSGNKQIKVIDPDGSNATILTEPTGAVGHSYPAWSPDGSRIAFRWFNYNYYAIETIKADGSDMKELISTESTGTVIDNLDWSPVK